MHDEAALSAEFKLLAAQADDQLRLLARAPEAPGHIDHDETLARSCVYGYLYERHFLESAEKLLNELRWLRHTRRPRAPGQALSGEQFDSCRDRLLDALIARIDASLG
jgi:hypothetical protein